ncbi:MAG: hypothetical protein JNJ44_12630 [Zoogloeaceae bacterium]|nr:hypothetical protein [Zoogloeaceae bacterium]
MVSPAIAQEQVLICYNYGCQSQEAVSFSAMQLEPIRTMLARTNDAVEERQDLAVAVGQLYRWAGTLTPIFADRAGDFADDGVPGRMDCIDHAVSTTGLLRMLERRGWLRFHRVLEPARRARFIFQHFSAVVEEIGPDPEATAEDIGPRQYAMDSWFVEHGEAAVVLPLEEWLRGAGPWVP